MQFGWTVPILGTMFIGIDSPFVIVGVFDSIGYLSLISFVSVKGNGQDTTYDITHCTKISGRVTTFSFFEFLGYMACL